MQLTPDPLTVRCDGSEQSTITVRVTDVNGRPVTDGTNVYFSAYNGNTTPAFAQTRSGVASTSVVFYGELFKPGPNVIVDAGVLEAGVRVRCFPNSNPPPPSPPPCPLSPPSSPPCVPPPTPTPVPCGSQPSVSPPCPTPTPYVPPTPYPTPTPSIGGEISLGTPTLAGGNIVVPVNTSASPNPYSGANVYVVFDRSLASAVSAGAGPVLQNPGGALCVSDLTYDAGALVACATIGTAETTAAGTLVTFTLAPSAPSGCVALHLFTYGPPDGGDATTGTYTMARIADDNVVVQKNTYGPDVTVDLATGATGCGLVPIEMTFTPTPTPTENISDCLTLPPSDACAPPTATPTP